MLAYEGGFTLTRSEWHCQEMLRSYGFLTATLKESVQAPSIQDGAGSFVIIPDIIAIDRKVRGWAFEVKDASRSRAEYRELRNYRGSVWVLEQHKANSYLKFSQAFNVPCMLVVKTRYGWRVGFLTKKKNDKIAFNDEIVFKGPSYINDSLILINNMFRIREFIDNLDTLRGEYWP
jgi:Holliday junction resolvase